MKQLYRILSVAFLALLLLSSLLLPVMASAEETRVVYDYADHLSVEEEASLTALAEKYRASLGKNRVAVVITDDYYSDAETEARNLGFTSRSDSCFILVVFLPQAHYHTYGYETYTLGDMSRFISDSDYKKIDLDDEMYTAIKSGRVYDGCTRFLTLVGEESAEISSRKLGRVLLIIGISLLLGGVAGALSVFLVWRSYNRKSRSTSYPLNDFTRLNLTVERDLFINKTVVRTRISTSSGGGRSGGGGGFSRGGGGGRSGGRH